MNYADEKFMHKLKIMSMIKGRLMELGKDPERIAQILMDDFDSKDPSGISKKMETVDPENVEEFNDLMKLVLEKM